MGEELFPKTKAYVALILVFIVAVILVAYFGLNYSEHKTIKASDSSTELSSKSDWEAGSNYNTDLDDSEGNIKIDLSIIDSWNTKTPMSINRGGLGSVVVNGKIYIVGGSIGGSTETGAVEEYDPSIDTWSTKTSMPTSRTEFSIAVANNKIYVIGGYANGPYRALDTVEEYDPSADTWSTKASMPTERGRSVAASYDGKIYVFGGSNGVYCEEYGFTTYVPMDTVEEYDPFTDAWSTKASMLTGRDTTAIEIIDGKIFVIGGRHMDDLGDCAYSTSIKNTVEEYNPSTDTWGTKTPMSTARYSLESAIINGKIYAIGGFSPTYLNTVEEYNPSTDTWSTKTSMLTARSGLGVESFDNKIYAIGGYILGGVTNVTEEFLLTGTATHTTASTQIDGQEGSDDKTLIEWTSFTPTQTVPENTTLTYQFRTSDNASDWTEWTGDYTYSGTPIDLTGLSDDRYLQVKATLSNTDGVSTPQIDDYTINFHNNQKPNQPTAQTAIIRN